MPQTPQDNTARAQAVRKAILQRLAILHPFALPATHLYIESRALVSPAAKRPEFDAALEWLLGRRMVESLPVPLDESAVEWRITAAGKSILEK